jgi:hypothetical protein
MFKVLGMFLVFVSWFGLNNGFDLKLIGSLLFGVFLICSEGPIWSLDVHRERKVAFSL